MFHVKQVWYYKLKVSRETKNSDLGPDEAFDTYVRLTIKSLQRGFRYQRSGSPSGASAQLLMHMYPSGSIGRRQALRSF